MSDGAELSPLDVVRRVYAGYCCIWAGVLPLSIAGSHRTGHPLRGLDLALLLLALALMLAGSVISWITERRGLRRGIECGRWDAEQLGGAEAWLSRKTAITAWISFGLSALIVATLRLHGMGFLPVLLFPWTSAWRMRGMLGAHRERANETAWHNLQPIRSEEWGQ